MDLKNILSEFNLDENGLKVLQQKVHKASSRDTGSELSEKDDLPTDDWNLMDNISDRIWYSNMEIGDKLRIGLEFYDLLPTYYHGLNPIHIAFLDNQITEPAQRKTVFDKFAYYLSSPHKYFVNTTGYILWVEFFECGGALSEEAWDSIVKSEFLTDEGIKNLLLFSGPAEYFQKSELYKKLLPNKEFHEYIFKSLAFSAFDIYGKIDKENAKSVLGQLDQSCCEIPGYQEVINKLN